MIRIRLAGVWSVVLFGASLRCASAQSSFAPSPGWRLDAAPAVPPPAAMDSKQPAAPKDFQEVKMGFQIAPGPFEPTWDSIRKNYPGVPAWFREAKFGVFVHWGPQASGRSGDWYARNLYRQGHPAYQNHFKNFGHPSGFGYKDVLNAWKAPKWDPAALTKEFYDAGMRFMMVVGVHHDNYDLWDSKYNPWNSVNVGPKKDMIGGWSREARKLGMRFCMTFHHEYSWWWWADAYKADTTGPKAGVPYDGNLTLADGRGKWWEGLDPRLLYNINLGEYSQVAEIPFARQGIFQDHQDYAKWYAERWALRIMDAIDKYDPDMFYTDGNSSEPFSGDHSGSGFKCDAGRRAIAHFYNRALAKHGKVDTLALIKFQKDNPSVGMTYEINIPGAIMTNQAWIGENPIGDWYYAPGYTYEAVTLVRSLIEYISRGGNYACAVPVDPEGGLEPQCVAMLKEIGAWMNVNSEGVYGSRAWDVWGEGSVVMPNGRLGIEQTGTPYTGQDIRFTARDGAVYAWLMGWPEDGKAVIRSLAKGAGKVTNVTLLGCESPVKWRQAGDGLEVVLPDQKPCKLAWCLKAAGTNLKAMPSSGREGWR
jgi:alpha-L-fucosidase